MERAAGAALAFTEPRCDLGISGERYGLADER
jgi:hypothetical protein